MSDVAKTGLDRFTPTRNSGIQNLERFTPQAGSDYRSRRNYDYGPDEHSNVSELSPYIRTGLLSEVEVARKALAQHSFVDAEKFIQEVFWRTYFKGYLENRPVLWDNYKMDLGQLLPRYEDSPTYLAAVTGETGIECFDSWSRELAETGYLHNHARMWFASIWIFTVKLPWQLGADFFLRHLMDGDAASNTLSWRWVAGLHTKGKSYLATSGNIARYTDDRFPDTQGLASHSFEIKDLHLHPEPQFENLPTEPEIETNAGLIVLDEDLRTTLQTDSVPDFVLGLYSEDCYCSHNLSESVKAFRRQALSNQLEAIGQTTQSDVCIQYEANAPAVIDWAKNRNIKRIYLAQVQVGPWRDLWKSIKPEVEASGIELVEFRHWWEAELFPHATGGFFKMKQRLPNLVERLTK